MESDERFKHLASDPRFKTLRKKQNKIKIDERFQSMFTDEKFTLKYSKDKRGRKSKKSSGDDLKKFYSLGEEQESYKKKSTLKGLKEIEDHEDDDVSEAVDTKLEERSPNTVSEGSSCEDEEEEVSALSTDQEGEFEKLSDRELEDETESDLSSSSDEAETDHEDEGADEIEINKIQYDWQPLDHDAEKTDIITRRLAIQNLDWTHLDVRDVYTLVNSIRPPLSVRMYISEFGKERLAKEEVNGPQELADMPQIDEEEEELKLLQDRMSALEKKDLKVKTYKANDYEDADEVLDMKNEEIRERIRRYQLSRMKYYYAIAEFDSSESAEAVYKELDGIEYEGSSLELDLRFVPDEMEFDPDDMKAECTKVPDLATYKAPQFINSALQQTTVKFTWDETDVKRQEKLQRAYTKEELDKDDLDAYLASDTDDEDEGEPDSQMNNCALEGAAKRDNNKYRELLKSLDEEEAKKKKVDVDVVWGDYEGDEQRNVEASKTERRAARAKTQSNRKNPSRSDEKEADADLDLLVMDARKEDHFEFNPDDDRFGAVYESGLYNIDPSHPNFKRTRAFDKMAEKKREKRQKTSR